MIEVTPEVTPPPASGSKRKLAVGVVGLVALVGAAVFAVSRISGGDQGGAASPEEAATEMFDALENEDALGVIDVLLPGERESLREPVSQLFDELRRFEVLSEDADPSAVGGIDVQFRLDDVVVEPTNVDDIVNVDISGEATLTVDGEALPIGDAILDNVDVDRSELDTDPSTEDFSLPLTAVEQDGRWYMSAFYSLAEAARREAGPDMAIPERGVVPNGGDGPEDAMDNIVDAVEQLDVEAMIATLNPQEWQALQRYAPLFLDDAQQALTELDGVEISIDDPVYTVSGSGDTRSLTVDELQVSVTAEGQTVTIEWADGCWVAEADDQRLDSCELVGDMPELEEIVDDPEAVQEFLDTAAAAFADYENPGLIVKRVDGQWYLSPMATMAEQFFSVSGALDRDEVEELVEQGRTAAESALDQLVPSEIFGRDVDDPFDDDPVVTVPPVTAPPVTAPPVDSVPLGTTESAAAGVDECYGETAAADAAACFQALIDAGEIDASSVEIQLRHPECGLADAFWAGAYYTLPDAEFVAVVEEAAPCFQALVGSGELSAGELPYELSNPACLEGRNWYQAIDDPDGDAYLDDFIACVAG